LEQVLPRQLLTGFDDPCYPPVLYLQAPCLAALALEVETQFATCHRNVTAAQRRQAVTAIIFRIILIPFSARRLRDKEAFVCSVSIRIDEAG
jgi:hypothetical protein